MFVSNQIQRFADILASLLEFINKLRKTRVVDKFIDETQLLVFRRNNSINLSYSVKDEEKIIKNLQLKVHSY